MVERYCTKYIALQQLTTSVRSFDFQPSGTTLHRMHTTSTRFSYLAALALMSLHASAQDNAAPLPTIALPEDDAVELEEVTVFGSLQLNERQAIEFQRESKSIISVVTSAGIGELPDNNAAEAVQRIPGVSIERDQGEGRFVAVRGLPSQFNSTTLNGDRLPTAEEETTTRATAFDFFPAEMIERIEVSKALRPDMEGDAIGGAVNFVTRTAPDERMLNVALGSPYNQKRGDFGYNASVLYGDRLLDNKFGFLINGVAFERPYATDNFEARRGSDGLGIRRLELRDYTGERTTYGINAGAEYEVTPDMTLFARSLYGTLSDEETHYKHRYRFDKDRVELQNIFNELVTEFASFEFGGEQLFLHSTLNWKLSTAENQFEYGCIPNCEDRAYFVVRFDQEDVGYEGLEDRGTGNMYAYNTIDGGTDPGYSPSTHLPGGFAMDPAQMGLANVNLYKVDVVERDNIVAQLDWDWSFRPNLDLKFGAKYRDKEREAVFADEFYAWDEEAAGRAAPTLAEFQLMDQPGRDDYNVHANGRNYAADFSPVVAQSQLVAWYNANREFLVLDEGESALVSNGGALGRNFNLDEQHTAGYGMATWTMDQWTLLGGIRLENTSTTVRSLVLEENTETGAAELVPNTGKKDYLAVLPSVHFTFDVSDHIKYRAAVTRSFARPDFGDLNPGGYYAEHDNEFFSGNSELNPTYALNFDSSVEYYFGSAGLISGGLFYKDITDPIFKSSSVGEYNGNAGTVFYRPENGDDASLYGAELALSRQFDFLPGIARHLGANANLTVMDSEMKIPGRSGKVAIPRQADLLYNLSGYYDDGAFSIRLSLNHKGAYIEEHGGDKQSDSYYGEFTSLDLSTAYRFNTEWLVYADLNNLTDESLVYYLGDEQRPLQVEYYEPRGQLGLKYNF